MRKSRITRGALYLIFAMVTPLILQGHAVIAGIQATLLAVLGVAIIASEVRR